MKKTVLFFHQSADLYGSDKVLLNLVKGIKSSCYYPIVLLPSDGPLAAELMNQEVETHIVSLTTIGRATLSIKGLLTLPSSIIRSLRSVNKVLNGRKIDLVHSNTLAVLTGAIWAKWKNIAHVWHVHEILLSPKLACNGFPFLLRILADRIICNSTATQDWVVRYQPRLLMRTCTIWNGTERYGFVGGGKEYQSPDLPDISRQEKIIVALVGRINKWKGQTLLIEAATILWEKGYENIQYVIVGSVSGQQFHFIDELNALIKVSPASKNFVMHNFTESIWEVWDACDIAVVPSLEPEPFGLVAIEAMCAGKPVVAAEHGGLMDIVDHGVTGFLFQPRNPKELAGAIARLADDPALREKMGKAGQRRQQKMFSLASQVLQTTECYNAMV